MEKTISALQNTVSQLRNDMNSINKKQVRPESRGSNTPQHSRTLRKRTSNPLTLKQSGPRKFESEAMVTKTGEPEIRTQSAMDESQGTQQLPNLN